MTPERRLGIAQPTARPVTYSQVGDVQKTIDQARAAYEGPGDLDTLSIAVAREREILRNWWLIRRAEAWRDVGLVRPPDTNRLAVWLAVWRAHVADTLKQAFGGLTGGGS